MLSIIIWFEKWLQQRLFEFKRRWRDKQCQFVYEVIDGRKVMELMLEHYDLIEQLIWIGGLFDLMVGFIFQEHNILLIPVLWEMLHWMIQFYRFMRTMGCDCCG
jgi:hypothetical protein